MVDLRGDGVDASIPCTLVGKCWGDDSLGLGCRG